ncbi:MAG: DNA polymerase I [Oscillibacter sp.]|nr:DNA polymerase I [Oscillibacter sp.]
MKLMVIDGNSIINRAYYGIRPLTNREGLYTHAVFGFLTTLLRLEGEEAPDGICVTFDLHAPTFRHKADASYKATRKPMPEELRQQVPVLKEVLDALNIPRYELEGWEADDLLGTISRTCEAAGWECVVVTGDKDSLQLIDGGTKVKLVSTRMGQTTTVDYTEEFFRETYGFDPIHMIDLKALMGDSSDNIPGVKGVGEKTAMGLVQMYGSIDHLYDHMPQIVTAPETPAKPGVIKKLSEGEEAARHSYWLATIVTDAPLDFRPEDNLRVAPGPEAYPLFLKLEFTKLIEKFHLSPEGAPVPETRKKPEAVVETVTDPVRGEELLVLWQAADHVSLLMRPDCSAVGVYCETEKGPAVMAELFFERYQGDWNGLLRVLFSEEVKKVSHNVKDLMRTLLENGLPAEGFLFDTALAAYLLDATAGSYDLQRLFVTYFNEELPKPLYLEPDAFSLLGDGEAAVSLDSHVTAVEALYGALKERLQARSQWGLFKTAELPLCRVLAEMERTGCGVDARALRDFGENLSARIAGQETSIYEMAGGNFNINSPKQLGEVLFERLGLPHGKKTKTGWSTNADVLEKLRFQHPIVEAVLEYRQFAKLKSTYADGLLKAMDSDGRVRTRFQMTVTATGRLSSTEPNLQNIPTRTDLGSEFRRMFTAEEGCVLVDADYSQIELRILAHIAGDGDMCSAFLAGGDFHAETAAKVFHVNREEVTHEMRRRAKAVNFGIVYGISAFSLSQDLGVTVAEAKAYMEAYFATFPGVRQYMDEVVRKAQETGYVETLFHRRRDLPELTSSNKNMQSFGQRVALNMPIQGTAADVMKLAMVAVWKRLRAEKPQARLALQVHDELIVECPEAEAEAVARLLEEEMENVVHLRVPLTAEAHWGKNWLEAKG